MSDRSRSLRCLVAAGLTRLVALWLAAAIAVLVAPSRPAHASDEDGVARTAYGEVSANASRRADLTQSAPADTGDDPKGDELACFFESSSLRAIALFVRRDHIERPAHARGVAHLRCSGPRGPPRT